MYFLFKKGEVEFDFMTNDEKKVIDIAVTDYKNRHQVNVYDLSLTELAELKGMIDVMITNLNDK